MAGQVLEFINQIQLLKFYLFNLRRYSASLKIDMHPYAAGLEVT